MWQDQFHQKKVAAIPCHIFIFTKSLQMRHFFALFKFIVYFIDYIKKLPIASNKGEMYTSPVCHYVFHGQFLQLQIYQFISIGRKLNKYTLEQAVAEK